MIYLLYLVIGALLSYFLLKRIFLEHFYLNIEGKYVFITGCDSGFGRLLTLKLLKMNVNVFAGCYTENGCEDLENKAQKMNGGRLYAIKLDITRDDSVENAFIVVKKVLDEENSQLHAVVNNAGVFTIFGPDDWCSTEEYMTSLNVNTLGTVRVCHKFLPLVKKSKGRIVTMGSTAGRLHGLYVGPYVTAKFAVEAYMDCLRLEMRAFNVSVHVLEPGAFKTELLSEQAQNARIHKIWNKLSSEVKREYGEEFKENFKIAWQTGVNIVANPNLYWVVDCYIHALFAWWPRMRYAPGWDAIFCFVPLSLVPTWVQDTVLSFMYSMQPGPPLVPIALKKIRRPTLLERIFSLTAKAGRISLLSIIVGGLYLKSFFPFVTARTVTPNNDTVSSN